MSERWMNESRGGEPAGMSQAWERSYYQSSVPVLNSLSTDISLRCLGSSLFFAIGKNLI
jgi:hypothetical protein